MSDFLHHRQLSVYNTSESHLQPLHLQPPTINMQLRLLLLALYGFMLGVIITGGVSASLVSRPLVGDVVSSALPGFGVSAVIEKAAEMAPGSRVSSSIFLFQHSI